MDQNKKKTSLLGKVPKFIRSIDSYGKEVKFTVKGEETYKTTIGGIWTILLMLGIIIYGAFQTDMMLKRGDTNISIKEFLKDRTNDREIYTPFEKGFQYSFIVEKDGLDLIQEGGYINVVVNQVEQTYELNEETGIKERNRTKTNLEYEKCGDNFFSDDEETKANLNIANYYCFSNNYFTIAGSYFSPVFHYLEIRMAECMNSTENNNGCRSPEEIYDKMNQADVKLGIINTYVDLHDYEDPVKFFIDDTFYWETVPNFRKKIDTEIQKNTGQFQDSLLQLFPADEVEFFQINKGMESLVLSGDDSEFLTIYLRTDQVYQVYDRKVYSVGDLLGQIGGFFEVIYAAGGFLTLLFVEKMITATIVSKIYQIRSPSSPNDSSPSSRNKSVISSSSILRNESNISMTPNNKNDETRTGDCAENEMKNRHKFSYTWKDIAHYMLCCAGLRLWFSKGKAKKQGVYHRHAMFKHAETRLKSELDVTEILTLLRKLRTIIALLFSNKQAVLLEYQRLNVLEAKSEKKGNGIVDARDLPFLENITLDKIIDGSHSSNLTVQRSCSLLIRDAVNEVLSHRNSGFDKKLYLGVLHKDIDKTDVGMYNIFESTRSLKNQNTMIRTCSKSFSGSKNGSNKDNDSSSHDSDSHENKEQLRNETEARTITIEHLVSKEDKIEESKENIKLSMRDDPSKDQDEDSFPPIYKIDVTDSGEMMSRRQHDFSTQSKFYTSKQSKNDKDFDDPLKSAQLTPAYDKTMKHRLPRNKSLGKVSFTTGFERSSFDDNISTPTTHIFMNKDKLVCNKKKFKTMKENAGSNQLTASRRSNTLLGAYEDRVTQRLNMDSKGNLALDDEENVDIQQPQSKSNTQGIVKIKKYGKLFEQYKDKENDL